jgi:16S rRNA (adenine1518-N6/adenine1519-N6)-dimethyltransferase
LQERRRQGEIWYTTGDMTAPKKSLGQHWLHDRTSLLAVADAVQVKPGDTVLEIGPGMGTLTKYLLEAGANVVAVEFDEELIPKLVKDFKSYGDQFRIEHTDILKFDFTKLPKGYKVAANIPYYLTSNLLRLMVESTNPFSQAALLVQKEVAERVCADKGDMSLLSVSVQLYADAMLGLVVPAELFTPPPKVDSQVLILRFHDEAKFDIDDKKVFFRLVKAGFSERRKKLRSSLSGGLQITKPEAEELLHAAGIDPNLRAQSLDLQQWYSLYSKYLTSIPSKPKF